GDAGASYPAYGSRLFLPSCRMAALARLIRPTRSNAFIGSVGLISAAPSGATVSYYQTYP
ncbi:hypothetical protein HMPREF0208_05100, partial [Citrobacter koseri]